MNHAIAFDIETCPQPVTSLSDRQKRRLDLELARELERLPEAEREGRRDEISRKVRSLHAALGWICCISVVRLDPSGEILTPRSYTAAHMGQEKDMLARFWADVAKMPDMAVWVSFNGKRFDLDWLFTRTLAHGLRLINRRLLRRNPYDNQGHVDLATLWKAHMGLADVCDLLGVENPKAELDGSGVDAAVRAGRIADVARYCEADVVATMRCYQRVFTHASAYIV